MSEVPDREGEAESVTEAAGDQIGGEAQLDGVINSLVEGDAQGDLSQTDPCCNSASNNRSSSSSSSSGSSQESSFSSEESDCDFSFLFNHKEVAENPLRAAMLQRFLSQYRNNPNDSHLQHLLSLILSGPEFSPRRNRLRHVSTLQDATRLLRLVNRKYKYANC